MPITFTGCTTHVYNDTDKTIKVKVDDGKGVTDLILEPKNFRAVTTRGDKVDITAGPENDDSKITRATVSPHTSVIVQNKGSSYQIWPSKMGDIRTPTETGKEERTWYDTFIEGCKTFLVGANNVKSIVK